ncbi:MAG: chorismate synthase [Alphaproteobacteria bacterium]|nr:chorismate synthase [Alphaproteobacteria bacterium]
MSFNQFGRLFRFTSWGESHGPAIGCVIDGCPSKISLNESDIQYWLDQRKPGQSRFTSQRQEEDKVEILSGVFDGHTTGTPISLLIKNKDQKPKDYDYLKDQFRPGHADYTYHVKYGLRDHRGGGRSSARETACRVAAGAVARKIIHHILGHDIIIQGALIQIGVHSINRANWNWNEINQNPFWCPDSTMVEIWAKYLDAIRKEGSSIGAMVEITARQVPAGLGCPIYGKLDADLATAFMGINAVKGIEIGDGFSCVTSKGEEYIDEISYDHPHIKFLSNHAGGILGGISTGQDIIVRFALKPTSSILKHIHSINQNNENITLTNKGRHDPCLGIRAVPVGEAMIAIVLADHLLLHLGQNGKITKSGI